MLHLVSVHADFVTANDRLETVVLAELLRNVGSELHANATLARATARLVLRIRPQHLHHETGLARLALGVPVELADIVQSYLVVREQTTVQDKVLGSDQGGKGQG